VSKAATAVAFLLTLSGVAAHEYYHVAATRFFVDYWNTPSDPMGPPKCKFDCALSVPQEIWMIGALGVAIILAGPAFPVIDWAIKRR
jgi:hypothetical protein